MPPPSGQPDAPPPYSEDEPPPVQGGYQMVPTAPPPSMTLQHSVSSKTCLCLKIMSTAIYRKFINVCEDFVWRLWRPYENRKNKYLQT